MGLDEKPFWYAGALNVYHMGGDYNYTRMELHDPAQVEPAKGAGSLACYVAKYVEKNLFARGSEDIGKKLVRYGGWKGTHTRSNDIAWANHRAAAWRLRAQVICSTVGVLRYPDAALAFGPRWGWALTGVMNDLDLVPSAFGVLAFADLVKDYAGRVLHNERWREDQEESRRYAEGLTT